MIKTIYWVSSSHWDREWHRPFEGFRSRLIEMLDRAIDYLSHQPAYGYFFLDGQSIILRDYLEARPGMERTVRQLVRRGKLFAGPFYVLQDEMVVPGELLARNLQRGIQLAQSYGVRKFVGWTPDSFGHCAQLPQLLHLAGVSSALCCRGLGSRGKQQENLWVAPDGSAVFLIWMPLCYGGFCYEDSLADNRHIPEDRETALRLFETRFAGLKPYVKGDAALVMDGGDHLYPDRNAVWLQTDFNAKHRGRPAFRISSIVEAVKAVRKCRRLHRLTGELRHFGKSSIDWILPGTHSTRMPLKYGLATNLRALLALEELATVRPFSAGLHADLERAWDLLLQNTPHDSICGCHTDPVYLDNLSRLNAVHSIVTHAQERLLGSFLPVGAKTGNRLRAIFFDPAPQPNVFKPFTVECPYERITEPDAVRLWSDQAEFIVTRVEPYETHQAHLKTHRICGVYRQRTAQPVFGASIETDGPISPSGVSGKTSAVRYRLAFARDGSFTLVDRQTATAYGPLMRLVDQADAGDTYNYSPPARDLRLTTRGQRQRVTVRTLNDRLVQAEVQVRFRVPAALAESRQQRSARRVELSVAYEVLADLETGMIRVEGKVLNQARDHRLRALFVPPRRPVWSFAGAPFHVEKRSIQAPSPVPGASEEPITDYPYIDFVSYGGVTVFSRSPGEYQVTREGLEITLCRCVGHVGRPDLAYRKAQGGPLYAAPLAQMVGEAIRFGFVLMPSLTDPGADYQRQWVLQETVAKCVLVDELEEKPRSLPLSVEGALLVGLRWLDARTLEARILNPRSVRVQANLSFQPRLGVAAPAAYIETDLLGQRIPKGLAGPATRTRSMALRPHQILTLHLKTG